MWTTAAGGSSLQSDAAWQALPLPLNATPQIGMQLLTKLGAGGYLSRLYIGDDRNTQSGDTWISAAGNLPSSGGSLYSMRLQPSGTSINGPGSNSSIRFLINDSTRFLIQNGSSTFSAAPVIITAQKLELGSFTFASPPASLTNGDLWYCSDCKNMTDDTTGTFDSAIASGGHGTMALFENGASRVH